jgi:endonuclease/exonuclease/phosphatase family metal-dependent hydrolase
MKQLQFVKKGFKPVSRTVKWLKRFSPKHRYHQMPADSSFSNQATFHGYRRFFFRSKLDYIFVPATVSVHDAQIIQMRQKRRYPSDHFPLFSHINLPETSVQQATI